MSEAEQVQDIKGWVIKLKNIVGEEMFKELESKTPNFKDLKKAMIQANSER